MNPPPARLYSRDATASGSTTMTPNTIAAAVRLIYRDAAMCSGLSDAELLVRFAANPDEAASRCWCGGTARWCWACAGASSAARTTPRTPSKSAFVALATRAGSVARSLAAWLYQVAYHARSGSARTRPPRDGGAARRGHRPGPGDERGRCRGARRGVGATPPQVPRTAGAGVPPGPSNGRSPSPLGCPIGTVFTACRAAGSAADGPGARGLVRAGAAGGRPRRRPR